MKKNQQITITTIIGAGAECDGDFTAQGSARIDGRVNGNVKVTGTVIVGTAGAINGNIEAQAAMIGGEVIGNVSADENGTDGNGKGDRRHQHRGDCD